MDVPLHAVPSHGKPRGRSQADAQPGADVRLSTLEVLRRQRVATIGDRQQVDGDRNEGEAREVQEQVGAGIGDHCSVPEPANPQAD